MVAVGKDFGLVRQIGAARVDQIDAGQTVLGRDLLGAQMLLHRHRVVGAALDRRIVGDDHDLAAVDKADARHQPRAVDVALIHAEGGERADFQKRRAGIDQAGDPFARQQLPPGDMTFARPARAALGRGAAAQVQFVNEPTPFRRVGFARAAVRRQCALYSKSSRCFSPIPALDLAEAQMLLSLFTRDPAGKSIADLIISFSEFLASVRACKLLFICNILSPSPACQTLRKGRRRRTSSVVWAAVREDALRPPSRGGARVNGFASAQMAS